MNISIEKKSEIEFQKQIDLAAESLARLLVQQVLSRKNPNFKKENDKYGKSN